ncbi:hypothetical protein EV2_042138 [Malus domestica]
MEFSIANHENKELIANYKKDKFFGHKMDKSVKESAKKAMMVNMVLVRISIREKKNEVKQNEPFHDHESYKHTLKELEKKSYVFLDTDVAAMLKDLLDKKLIELPECKRPEEMN